MLSVGKVVCLILVSTAFIPSISADSESYSVQYGDSLNMDTPFSNFRDGNKFVGCNSEVSFSGAAGDVNIPRDLPCSMGTHEIEVYHDSHGDTDGFEYEYSHSLSVEAGMGNPNKGHYVVSRFGVMTDPSNPSKARDFFLTDEPWYDDDNGGFGDFNEFPDHDTGRPVEKGAFFLISEADGNLGDKSDEGIYIAQYGDIIRAFSSSLGEHVLGRYTTTRGGPPEGWFAGGPPEHISQSLNRDFDQGYKKQYGKNGDGGCHVSQGSPRYEWNGNCAPLHNNGIYEPQGEIIVASEPEASFADPSDRPLSISSSTHFYVCRNHPSDSNWQGNKPSNSQVVKVQEKEEGNLVDEWRYYHCNTNNDWEEVECPPGQEVRGESSDLECVNKAPVTVNVQFFDVSDVPEKLSGESVIAGLKVESSQAAKYERFMGEELKQIDAECWMGDDDPTPRSSGTGTSELPETSDTGTFRLNYDGSGDAWVLGEIPYRTGVNNNTYSCVWGFSQEAQYSRTSPPRLITPSIYESTRYPPFRSVEASRHDVDYSTLVNEYNSLISTSEIDEDVDSSQLWTPYSRGDTRPYTDSTQTDMFEYPNEFPYCEQPPYSGALKDVYDEIICS